MFKLDNNYSDYVDTTDPKYPGGKAVDASAADMFDGTPFKAAMVDQIFGFFQAAIKEAWGALNFDVHLSGNPDDADDSDVVDAFLEIIRQKVAAHAVLTGSNGVHGAAVTAVANAIITRDANGRAQIVNPDKLAEIATREYVEKLLKNYTFLAVVAATSGNITLSGTQTIDGVAVAASDLVLVKNQTDPKENGVYVCQTGAWNRSTAFDSDSDIRNKLVCVQKGALNENKIFQVFSDTITVGTSPINFTELPLSLSGGCQKVIRKKIAACPDNRPAIGIPTLWMAPKPDWALDFGNGGGKYLWSNYPELFNEEFLQLLKYLSDYGWMTAPDEDASGGFYVPDLRGIVPIGYGINGVRTTFIHSGNYLGSFSDSRNLYHRHGKGDYRIVGEVDWFRKQIRASDDNQSSGALEFKSYQGQANSDKVDTSSTSTKTLWRLNIDTNFNSGGGFSGSSGYNGIAEGTTPYAGKPGTIGCMWILRFE